MYIFANCPTGKIQCKLSNRRLNKQKHKLRNDLLLKFSIQISIRFIYIRNTNIKPISHNARPALKTRPSHRKTNTSASLKHIKRDPIHSRRRTLPPSEFPGISTVGKLSSGGTHAKRALSIWRRPAIDFYVCARVGHVTEDPLENHLVSIPLGPEDRAVWVMGRQ